MVDVIVQGKRHRLDPASAIGKGGEADVYDVGGAALKLFKAPDHPDFVGQPEMQKVARLRIDEHQQKLRDFPRNLPPRVITPEALATDAKGRIVGYRMRFLRGAEVLMRYGQRSFRQGVPTMDALAVLRDLHGTVKKIHDAKVVIGDFNDLNVLVSGSEAYVIDADSMQFGRFACTVFTARFVDPLKCDPAADSPSLILHHDEMSDWYAFNVMVMQTLLFVDPYGGVYKPKDPKKLVLHNARPLKRLTVFHPEVKYPRPAVPYKVLPDELLQHFHQTFEKDARREFPLPLLEQMRWTNCTACGTEHARAKCPECATAAPASIKEVVVVRGTVKATRLYRGRGTVLRATVDGKTLRHLLHENGAFRREDGSVLFKGDLDPLLRIRLQGEATWIGKGNEAVRIAPNASPFKIHTDTLGNVPVYDVNADHAYWTKNDVLWRDDPLGQERVGDVLSGQTMIWAGPAFGFGFYRAGALSVGFVFNAKSRGINDRVKLPPMRGKLIDASCTFTKDRVWLFVSVQEGARTVNRCAVIKADGSVEAEAEAEAGDGTWLGHIRGGAALEGTRILLTPTDDGVVRVEADQGRIAVTKTYPDTEAFVDAGTKLLPAPDGLYAIRRSEIVKLEIK